MPVQYIGEHLFPGDLGKSLIWLGFLTAILAAFFYLVEFYRKERAGAWKPAARWMYTVHSLSVAGAAAVLCYIIFSHYFEYSYVWEYSSRELPVRYIVSCFWAGQEGSLLVWALWQSLTGLVLLRLARDWEAPVMFVFSLSQVFLVSMLLGAAIPGVTIGASPFALLRETIGTVKGTIFSMPHYLSLIRDGNGLNPLLENIWMTIHPPVLFLGYALTLVPFSYAIASFLKKDYHTWICRARPWMLIALFMLGGGILIGGAWAYVSLTFGGFWSWDPVENSSLIPWMTLVAGLHFLFTARRQNFGLFAAYLLITLSYVLVLYATFLTRSGVLADTSAHSFGDNGMALQLLAYLLTFLAGTVVLLIIHFRKFHVPKQDILLSREFWMFIGAIVIVLSAFQIMVTTSIPVINRIFHTGAAPPADRTGFYNRWQLPYALLITGFIALTQFLNYAENRPVKFLQKMAVPLALSVMAAAVFRATGIVTQWNFILLSFFTLFAVISSVFNALYRTSAPVNIPAVVTHAGFAIFLLGTVLTFSNSRVISKNTSAVDLGNSRANDENLVLARGDTLSLGGFFATYSGNRTDGNTTVYKVDFLKAVKGKYRLAFTLCPSVNVHPRMGAVYNPDTRHFLTRDYYTYIAMVSKDPDFIVIRAIMNPYINVLWLGAIVMLGGFASALAVRARRLRLATR